MYTCVQGITEESQIVSQNIFEKSIKPIYKYTFLGIPKIIPFKNSLTFIVYNNELTYYVHLLIYNTGDISVLFVDKRQSITESLVLSMIDQCNNIIREINKDKLYSEYFQEIPEIINQPVSLSCDIIFLIY